MRFFGLVWTQTFTQDFTQIKLRYLGENLAAEASVGDGHVQSRVWWLNEGVGDGHVQSSILPTLPAT